MKGVLLFLATAYLDPDHRGADAPKNNRRLQELAGAIGALGIAFVLIGDWNLEPHQMVAAGFPASIAGKIIIPDCDRTCTQGSGRILDYIIASDSVAPLISASLDMSGPWKPHYGMFVSISLDAEDVQVRAFERPCPIPLATGPSSSSWEECLARAQSYEFDWATKRAPQYPFDQVAVSSSLSSDLAAFHVASALYELGRSEVDPDQTDAYIGNGCVPIVKDTTVKGPSKPPTLHTDAESFWSCITSRLHDLKGLFKSGQMAGAHARRVLDTLAAASRRVAQVIDLSVPAKDRKDADKMNETTVFWEDTFRHVHDWTILDIDRYITLGETCLEFAHRSSITHHKSETSKWVRRSLADYCRDLHRFVRGK